ncbi:hypothetical protein G6683_01860 [Polynucleobacter paneuropaeus]|nr:hypothetical protein [Polynucleobacter paneuropaeus]
MFIGKKQYVLNRAYVEGVEKAILNGQLNSALNSLHNFVDRIFANTNFTARVFGSCELDRLCLKIGSQNLTDLRRPSNDSLIRSGGQVEVIYLVSCLHASGGHSRLVLDFIRAQPGKDHLILSTGVGGRVDKEFLAQLNAVDPNARFISAPRGNLLSRLTWLQNMLLSHAPEHVHLLNHHQDSVAVAAIVPELGFKGSFHHHGDHHFSLGVFLEHLTHVDFHPMGYHFCRKTLGVNNTYLPLTFKVQKPDFAAAGEENSWKLTTATVARSNKVEIPYHVNYADVVPKILKATGGKHVHIGKLSQWTLWKIRRGMRELGVPSDRLVYIDHSSSVWKSMQDNCVDIYISSFPYGAGLTLVEVMGAGIPVIMHHHINSRVLSGLELAYPEAFFWKYSEELISHLVNLDRSSVEFERLLSRRHYEKFHRPEILSNYFSNPFSFKVEVPSLSEKFIPRYDGSNARIVDINHSLSHFMYVLLSRLWRRLRRYLS